MREIIHLNYHWYFSDLYKPEYVTNFSDVTDFSMVSLPHSGKVYADNYLPEPACFGKYIYKRKLDICFQNDRKYQIRFKGVAHQASVYMNEQFIVTHEGGYDEFLVDISHAINKDCDNWLSVVVDESENPDIPPFGGVVDYLGYGGIYREVELEILEQSSLQNVRIKANENLDGFICEVHKEGIANQIQISIYFEKQEVGNGRLDMLDDHIVFSQKIANLKRWDIDHPHLYTFIISLFNNEKKTDEKQIKFGFRSFAFTKEGFFLNERHVTLRGLNRHQSYPYVGYAMPKSAQESDANILKYELGVNMVRTSHYMVSEHFLNRCDEIGLLVMEEIPGWQHIGEDQFKQNTLHNTQAMIMRDYNHPAIVLWGVRINESADDDDLYQKTNELAHKLDPTRPTGGVRNFSHSHMFEDVYTFNDFTHAGLKKAIQNPKHVKKQVPYLITEHNGHMFPTKAFDDEPHRVSQALRHEAVLKAIGQHKQIAGAIGWCMNDYHTHKEFGSGDKVCYHGVLDMNRHPKYAAYVYSAQSEDKIVLEVLSDMNLGDYPKSFQDALYIATNCDFVRIYKDNYYIGEFQAKKQKNYLHPLIKVTDFFGNILCDQYHFSAFDAKLTKKLFHQIQKNINLPFFSQLKMLYILVKYHISQKQAITMFYQLTASSDVWRFDGYQNQQLVKSVTKGKQTKTHWEIKPDESTLKHKNTYDVTRVNLSKVDQNNHALVYAFDPIHIKTSGGIGVIGPTQRTLKAGRCAFWVKTTGTSQEGTIEVTTVDQVLTQTIVIEVEK